MAVMPLEPEDLDAWSLRTGALEVRLARTPEEVAASQALRYRIFYEEMTARPTDEMAAALRDFDPYDAVADHLLVLDHSDDGDYTHDRVDGNHGGGRVVGTYRLVPSDAAARIGQFYTADEYDIAPLYDFSGNLLELGRSCVDAGFRTGQTMQLLWRGIAAYVFEHKIGLMFGCASFPGVDQDKLALPLSYLYHQRLAPPEMRPRALDSRYVFMNRIPLEALDARAGLAQVPPLIKGYLRLGGYIGDGAVIDEQFQTTDVCVVVETERVTRKYLDHYLRREGRPISADKAP